MKKFNKWFARYSSVVIVSLLLLMICSAMVGVWYTFEHMVNVTESAVGDAYSEDFSVAEKMLYYITGSELSTENDTRYKKAVSEYGYTEDAVYRVFVYQMNSGAVWFVVAAILLFLVIVAVFKNQKCVARHIDEERILIKDEVRKEQDIENAYMDKRKGQMQNYLENVAHQTRTPLTNVMLGIDSIYEEQSDQNKQILDECNYHIERVNKLMTRFLKMGRLEAGEIVMEKQQDSVKELLLDVISSLNDGDRVKAYLNEVCISMDRQWMYEAFACLVENCLENSVKEGRKCPVEVTMTVEDDMVIILVRDYGDGFDEEDIGHIFDRFYTKNSEKAVGHYGIGLNLAKLVIEAHYGAVKAYNASDGGAVFRVVLPKINLKDGKMSR